MSRGLGAAVGTVFRLKASDDAELTEQESAGRRSQVNRAGCGRELDAVRLGEIDEILVLPRLAGQTVSGPGDDGPRPTGTDVGQHCLVAGTAPLVVGAEVVVDVDAGNRPAEPLHELAAGRFLALDPKQLAILSAGDAAVDRRRDGLGHARSVACRRWFLNTR